MTVSCLAGLHDAFRPMVEDGLLRNVKAGIGAKFPFTVEFDDGGCYRSLEEQQVLYQKYLAGGPLAAPPGESAHNYGLAVDIHVVENGVSKWSGINFEIAMTNFVNAGCVRLPPQYNDPGHLEHPQWRTLAKLGNNPVTNPTGPTPPLPSPSTPSSTPQSDQGPGPSGGVYPRCSC